MLEEVEGYGILEETGSSIIEKWSIEFCDKRVLILFHGKHVIMSKSTYCISTTKMALRAFMCKSDTLIVANRFTSMT